MDKITESFGLLQLGEVTSYGRWEILDGQMQITFETQSLSTEKQRQLEHYRHTSRPIQVQLPGDKTTLRGVVKGFERDQNTATFYVTRQEK